MLGESTFSKLRNPIRGEGVVSHERRPFGVRYSEIGLLQRLTIERAKIAPNRRANPFQRAEALLSADIQR